MTCVPFLVETFGGLSPALMRELRAAAEWRSNKLTSSEYDETTWSARTWLTFVAQRLSVAVQLSVAQEAAEALGLSVAADPRARRESLQGPAWALGRITAQAQLALVNLLVSVLVLHSTNMSKLRVRYAAVRGSGTPHLADR